MFKVDTKSFKSILSSIGLLTDRARDTIKLTFNDDYLYIHYVSRTANVTERIISQGHSPLNASSFVSHYDLKSFMTQHRDPHTIFDIEDGSLKIVFGDNFHFTFNKCIEKELPQLNTESLVLTDIEDSEKLTEMVSAALKIITSESARNYGSVIHFSGTKICACDGFRLAYSDYNIPSLRDTNWPEPSVRYILSVLKRDGKLRIGLLEDNIGVIQSFDMTSSFRLSNIKFPRFEAVIPSTSVDYESVGFETKEILSVSKKCLSQADKTKLFNTELDDKNLTFRLPNGALSIPHSSSIVRQRSIGLNGKFICDALATKSKNVTFSFKSDEDPVKITSDHVTTILVPQRKEA